LSSLLLSFLFMYHYARPKHSTEEILQTEAFEHLSTKKPVYYL